jgi:hypothetical protein
MDTAQQFKTISELRQEMWAAHNRFSDLQAELIRLKESEPGSLRYLQILDEHLEAKEELDCLKNLLDKKRSERFNNGIASGIGLTPHGQTVLWMMVILFVIAVFALWEPFRIMFQIYKVVEGIIKAALTG